VDLNTQNPGLPQKDPTIPPRDNKSPQGAPAYPSQDINVPHEAPNYPKAGLSRWQKTRVGGQKRPVVEHKGIVGRVDAFLPATVAVSVASDVGQISSRVRPMFDAELTRRKMSKKAFLSPYM
jgi:hypothetical protein